MEHSLRVLMITSEWPTLEHPDWVPFLVQEVEFLRRAGVNVDVFSFRGAKRPWSYWKARKEVEKKMVQNRYDLIHTQYGQSTLLVLPQKKYPLVATFHGSDVEGIIGKNGHYTIAGKILQKVSFFGASQADEVILVSQKLKRHLPIRHYNIIPCGLNLDLFQPMDMFSARQELGFAHGDVLVLFGGRPSVAEKRFSLAQTVIGLLKADFPAIHLVALEGIPHNRVPLYMNACNALLVVSFHEGGPVVVKEALACNLPVVSTDVGDVRERISSIDGCFVCDNDKPETIALALKQVLVMEKRIKGRETISDLDENLLVQKILAVYEKALSE